MIGLFLARYGQSRSQGGAKATKRYNDPQPLWQMDNSSSAAAGLEKMAYLSHILPSHNKHETNFLTLDKL